ncbi:MAG TPA: hypothetical protein VIG32_02775 [Candidatus Baltobacteraceae bacterium]
MLANALFFASVIALAATTILSGGLAMTRASEHRIAEQYLTAGFERAAAAARETIASRLRDGAVDPRALAPALSVAPLPARCAGETVPCSFYTGARVTFDNVQNVRVSSSPAACDAATTNCAENLESNDRVDEGRLAARIVVDVSAPDGTVLATRTQTLTLRTFAAPPYATIAGVRDASLADTVASEGDDGGHAVPAGADCGPVAGDETVVRVQYRNAVSDACANGSRWQRQGWSSGNGNATGWSP